MAEIEFIENIKDGVNSIKNKVGTKNFYLIGAGCVAVLVYFLAKNNSDEVVTKNATAYDGYPFLDGDYFVGGDIVHDEAGAPSGTTDGVINAGNGTGIKSEGMTAAGNLYNDLTASKDENILSSKDGVLYSDNEQNVIISEKVLSDSGTAEYNTWSTVGAFRKYYDEVTGGGQTIKQTLKDGTTRTVYRPYVKDGVDKNNDGGLSVSFDKDGNLVSSEFNKQSVSVSMYDNVVTTKVYDETRKASNATVETTNVKDLPTYTEEKTYVQGSNTPKSSGGNSSSGKSVTVVKSGSSNASKASGGSGNITSASALSSASAERKADIAKKILG